jgi:GH15 family glucan-1,4-alpha-glucosidase
MDGSTMMNDAEWLRDEQAYRPIRDYGLIGNAYTAALVARNGSIDWCCWPRFDSPAVFCRLLDAAKGGWFRVEPRNAASSSRSYLGPTNVLATTFTTDGGQVRLTDFMPVERHNVGGSEKIQSSHRILRLVEGLGGPAELEVHFRPTFDFAQAQTEIWPSPAGVVARGDRESLDLTSSVPLQLQPDGSGGLRGVVPITAGERLWIGLQYRSDGPTAPSPIDPGEAETALRRTLEYWTVVRALRL